MTDHKETDSKKVLTAEDVRLWREMTRDVAPMEGRDYVQPDDTTEVKRPRQKAIPAQPIISIEEKSSPKMPQGTDIDRNTMKRLKRGELRVEARLDLHGMNQGAARQALIGFIKSAQLSGKRCVLVVTGKGNTGRRGDDWLGRKPGVLKQNVPLWLREGDFAGLVLQAVPAQPKDGGDGALYVYLRRNRH